MKPLTVLLVEDYMIVRGGLRSLLKTATDIEIVAEAEDGTAGSRLNPQTLVKRYYPDLSSGSNAKSPLGFHPMAENIILF